MKHETPPTTLLDLNEKHPDWESAPKINVICPSCKTGHWHNGLLAHLFPNTLCDPCSDMQNALTGDNAYRHPIQTKQSLLDACMPSLYQDTQASRIPPDQIKQINSWEFNPIGLWVTGDTRTFKTRSICLLLKRLIEDGKHSISSFFHGDFHDQLLDVFHAKSSLKEFKRNPSNAHILFIDDIFASRLTERAESTLFEIFDARIAKQLPTLVTTQITKPDALRRFTSRKRHEAFYARIKEFFTLVNTNSFAQAKLHLSK